MVGDKAWVAGGDYNVVRASTEAVRRGPLDNEAMNDFNNCFRASRVDIPVATESDHCSLNITVLPEVAQEPKPFKYQHFWSQHYLFSGIVNECWGKEFPGHEMFVLHSKTKDVRKALKNLNQEEFSCITSRAKEKQIELDEVKCKVYDANLDPSMLMKAVNLNAEYRRLSDAERQLYQNKARM
ncbi:hypothetical protein LIER_37633 [Lithospermum erythrorhizon]|uniref:Uncharacterized protein n=1 Tax=Lithospermum erythrorhizon TaxID=34254 RepID=A0AAV3PS96_LITER